MLLLQAQGNVFSREKIAFQWNKRKQMEKQTHKMTSQQTQWVK